MNQAQQLQSLLDPTTRAQADVKQPLPLVLHNNEIPSHRDDYLCIDIGLYINICDYNRNGGNYTSEIIKQAWAKSEYSRAEVELFITKLENLIAITRAKMIETERKLHNMTINPCMVCGKEVTWGVDGCPVVDKGSEMGVLFGAYHGYKHYQCEFNPEKL